MNPPVFPLCGSDNISPMEHGYKNEYPLFMILLVVAVVSKFLEMSSKSRKKAREVEYLCMSYGSRFIRTESQDDSP